MCLIHVQYHTVFCPVQLLLTMYGSEKPCSGSRSDSGTARVPASSNTHVSPPPVISLTVEGLWRSFCNGISVATSPVTPVNRHVTMAGPSDCEHRSSLSVPITRTADRLASVNIVSELRYRGYVVGPTLGKGTYAKVSNLGLVCINPKVSDLV